MKVVLFGANGQVGQAFLGLAPREWEVQSFSRAEADFSDPDSVVRILQRVLRQGRPDWIVNAAAYTQVDRAETERDLCQLGNVTTVGKIAEFAAREKIPLIHYSSDYVYSGEGDVPFEENSATAPQSFYGLSKLMGDEAVEAAGGDHLIFRTSWVYSHVGKNFVLTMLKLGQEREELKIVSDQTGSPTYAPDLAQWTIQAMEQATDMSPFPSGVYHATNSGWTTWFDFAQAIFSRAREAGFALKVTSVKPILSSEYVTPAKRPLNSRVSLQKIKAIFGIAPQAWQEALRSCFEQIKT